MSSDSESDSGHFQWGEDDGDDDDAMQDVGSVAAQPRVPVVRQSPVRTPPTAVRSEEDETTEQRAMAEALLQKRMDAAATGHTAVSARVKARTTAHAAIKVPVVNHPPPSALQQRLVDLQNVISGGAAAITDHAFPSTLQQAADATSGMLQRLRDPHVGVVTFQEIARTRDLVERGGDLQTLTAEQKRVHDEIVRTCPGIIPEMILDIRDARIDEAANSMLRRRPTHATRAGAPESDTAPTGEEKSAFNRIAPRTQTVTASKHTSLLLNAFVKMATVIGTPPLAAISDHQDRLTPTRVQADVAESIALSGVRVVMRASHAARILAEAGCWPVVDTHTNTQHMRSFRQCAQGLQCVMRIDDYWKDRGSGWTMMAYMHEDEYDRFVASGIQPDGIERRSCLMCIRKAQVTMHHLQNSNSQYLKQDVCNNVPFSILTDQADGYRLWACILPPSHVVGNITQQSGMQPMLQFIPGHYRQVRMQFGHGQNCRRFLDESVFRFDPKSLDTRSPMFGESLQYFAERVKQQATLRMKTDVPFLFEQAAFFNPLACLARDFPRLMPSIFPDRWISAFVRNCAVSSGSYVVQKTALCYLPKADAVAAYRRLGMLMRSLDDVFSQENPVPCRKYRILRHLRYMLADAHFDKDYERHTGSPMTETTRCRLRLHCGTVSDVGVSINNHIASFNWFGDDFAKAASTFTQWLQKAMPRRCGTRMTANMYQKLLRKIPDAHVAMAAICYLSLTGIHHTALPPRMIRRNGGECKSEDEDSYAAMCLSDEQMFGIRCLYLTRPELLSDITLFVPWLSVMCTRDVMYNTLAEDVVFYKELCTTQGVHVAATIVDVVMSYTRESIRRYLDPHHFLAIMNHEKEKARIQAETQTVNRALEVELKELYESATGNTLHLACRRARARHQKAARFLQFRIFNRAVFNVVSSVVRVGSSLHLNALHPKVRESAVVKICAYKTKAPPPPPEVCVAITKFMQATAHAIQNVDAVLEILIQADTFNNPNADLDAFYRRLRNLCDQFNRKTQHDRGFEIVMKGSTLNRQDAVFTTNTREIALLKTLVAAYKEHTESVGLLGGHYAIAQYNAIRRFHFLADPDSVIPMEAMMLLSCDVCNRIYSPLQGAPTRRPPTVDKPSLRARRFIRPKPRDTRRSDRIPAKQAIRTMYNNTKLRNGAELRASQKQIQRALDDGLQQTIANRATWQQNMIDAYRDIVTTASRWDDSVLSLTPPELDQIHKDTHVPVVLAISLNVTQTQRVASVIGKAESIVGVAASKGGGASKLADGAFGNWGAKVEHTSGTTYCRSNYEAGDRKCGDRPLRRTPLLNRVAMINRRYIFMCPCCSMFASYTREGTACVDGLLLCINCSLSHYDNVAISSIMRFMHLGCGEDVQARCSVCVTNVVLRSGVDPKTVLVFQDGVIVCGRCRANDYRVRFRIYEQMRRSPKLIADGPGYKEAIVNTCIKTNKRVRETGRCISAGNKGHSKSSTNRRKYMRDDTGGRVPRSQGPVRDISK